MGQATVFKSAGTCTDTSLGLFYKDPAITADCEFCYDALDTISYPEQADGGASWIDLTPNGATATIGAQVGWSATSGFTFSTSTSTDKIALPAVATLTGSEAGMMMILWIKHVDTAAASGDMTEGIAGSGENPTTTNQYSFEFNPFALTHYLVMRFMGTVAYQFAGTPNAIYQLAIFATKQGGGGYSYSAAVNGVVVATATTASAMPTASIPAPYIGQLGVNTYQRTWDGSACRALFYTAATNAAAIIAADYAANVGRFS